MGEAQDKAAWAERKPGGRPRSQAAKPPSDPNSCCARAETDAHTHRGGGRVSRLGELWPTGSEQIQD